MHFTVIFESHESHDLSYGLAFVPCPVWKKGDAELLNLHPQRPQYEKGDLVPLLKGENISQRLAEGRRRAIVVVHGTGHGTEQDHATLQADLEDTGFAVQRVIFRD